MAHDDAAVVALAGFLNGQETPEVSVKAPKVNPNLLTEKEYDQIITLLTSSNHDLAIKMAYTWGTLIALLEINGHCLPDGVIFHNLRPQQVQLAQAGRKLSPVVSGNEAKDADYARLRVAREAGCKRACGMDAGPKLPICTKCFENLHAGKWTGDVANGEFNFGHGDNWQHIFTVASKVRGWIKPSGVAA
jgi:hypothetical protein